MSIEPVMTFNHLSLGRSFLLLPSNFPSIRVLSNELAPHIRWPKYWSFNFSISPSSEHPGLISFRMDWLDLLAVQGTHKSLLQHYSSKASILWYSAFFIVQCSHLCMTPGKTIALSKWIFVGKVMSLFNMVSRWVITFLPRSKRLLILARFCALVCLGKEQCSRAGCSSVCPVSIPSLADPSLVTHGESHGKLAEYFHIHRGRL